MSSFYIKNYYVSDVSGKFIFIYPEVLYRWEEVSNILKQITTSIFFPDVSYI
jgi:hypothetical protein